jgi:Ca2+-binding EF-hand superfamily protein
VVRFPLFALALVTPAAVLAQAGTPQSVPRAKIVANAEAEFARVDANKDGQMSRAEIEASQLASITARVNARNKALFAELDTDKNGQISSVEFAKASPAPKPDATPVLRIDTNKDGQVSLAEHRNATIETFNKIDANKDGLITGLEVKAAAEGNAGASSR